MKLKAILIDENLHSAVRLAVVLKPGATIKGITEDLLRDWVDKNLPSNKIIRQKMQVTNGGVK